MRRLTPCQHDQSPTSRGAEAERMRRGAEEGLRRGRASPTQTGCAQRPRRAPKKAGRATERAGGHRTRSRPPRGSQGAQERHTLPEVVQGCPLTITRSQPNQTHHRPRRAADRPQGWRMAWHTVRATQRAHRGRREPGAGLGCGRYLLNKEDPQQSRRRSEKNFEKIEKNS